ncbi:2-oxoglutarate dehydrogenase, E2 component, dihydrolipoamide succinyltransferase [Catelliglobosispora koreensis]|uniref:2-oxoglutarate dehydrogenase, E2 component, dihydrolipoamide succinyltransferase n=1 Tax=Catelliglobosispora koreensis TaxID=129052 RepID=UPI0003A3D93D|nr:2-oxoglutarate dehydrogenase, E2 component, dihydrolipoamide succinyltransferase [Catelliglobosispora koreensis]
MPVSVTMPRLGESVTEGTVTRWLKAEGERVEADEPLLEVSTDKVDTEIPSPAAGILQKILVAEDETAEVGSELAIIADEGEAGAPAPAQEEKPAPAQEEAPAPAAEEKPAPAEATPAPAAAAKPEAAAKPAGEGTPVKMPALGESVTEGTVTRWLKQVGENVEVDEPLLEVSTDKVDTEIPSPVAGVLLEIAVPEDETAAVGATLAVIGAADGAAAPSTQDTPAPPAAQETTPPPAAEPAAPAEKPAQTPPPQPAQQQPTAPVIESAPAPALAAESVNGNGAADGYVTPLVRKLAAQHGVDLNKVQGTGVGGRIRKQDVMDAAEKAKAPAPAAAAKSAPAEKAKAEPSPLRGRTEKLPRLRMTIAKRMVESLQVSAQLTTVVEVDVTRIAKLREQAKADFVKTHGVKLSYLPFFALAAVEALRAYPNVNASMDMEAGTVTYHDAEHLGMAVDTEKGLIVPVIKNAGDLNLAGLAKRIADVADRTRNNKIMPDDLSGGTFTLTNTGSRGALFDTPIINQPQVAILGTGAVVKRAVVVDDAELGEIIVPRSMVYLALSYDHRLVDGADAARFLTAIKERLEAGNFEAELGL